MLYKLLKLLSSFPYEETYTLDTSITQWVMRIAGAFILLSLLLAYLHSPNWLWFTTFVGANLFQSSFTGFCPLAKILVTMGVKDGSAFSVQ
jgi:hypothetical protein